MKNSIIVLFVFCLSLFSQIELENDYGMGTLYTVHLKNSGVKYYMFNRDQEKLVLYNVDHSIFKEIYVPMYDDGSTPIGVYSISEGLFTLDGKVSFIVIYMNTITDIRYRAEILDETTNSLAWIDNCNYAYPVQTPNGAKLIVHKYISADERESAVYSLPGSVKIEGGSSNNFPLSPKIYNSYPNPSNGTAVINYELSGNEKRGMITLYNIKGEEVKSYRVDNSFSSIHVNTSKLSSGTYFYRLKTDNRITEPKKITVMK